MLDRRKGAGKISKAQKLLGNLGAMFGLNMNFRSFTQKFHISSIIFKLAMCKKAHKKLVHKRLDRA